MGLLERVLFWIAIVVLAVALIGVKSNISSLEQQIAQGVQVQTSSDDADEEENEETSEDEEEEEE